MIERDTFRQRYGSWALGIGGSDGLGADFARGVAGEGLNCILVARRLPALESPAAELKELSGVEVRTASIDIAQDNAVEKLLDVAADVDLGLVVFNAGADSS